MPTLPLRRLVAYVLPTLALLAVGAALLWLLPADSAQAESAPPETTARAGDQQTTGAETTVWSATLTVGKDPNLVTGAQGYAGESADFGEEGVGRFGALSDTSIEVGDTTYTVQSLRWGTGDGSSRTLRLDLDKGGLPSTEYSQWALHIGNREFTVIDNSLYASSRWYFQWGSFTNPPALGETVTVKITKSVPDATAGLAAASENQQVKLTWSKPTDFRITKYQYRQKAGTGNYGNWTDIPGSNRHTTSHTVTSLNNGTKYTFQVRAVNDGGGGAASDEASATPARPPAKPTGMKATAGDTQITLSWNNPNDSSITGYEYRWDATNPFEATDPVEITTIDWTVLPASDKDTTSYTFIGLKNEVKYTFWLRAVKPEVKGPASNQVWATPVPAPNNQPSFDGTQPTQYSVVENSSISTVIATIKATDADGNPVNFALEDNADSQFFSIHPGTGKITARNNLDFESRLGAGKVYNPYRVTVTISDRLGATRVDDDTVIDARLAIVITVTDVEELGSITFSSDIPYPGRPISAALADSDGIEAIVSWEWFSSSDRQEWTKIEGASSFTYTPTSTDKGQYLKVHAHYVDRRNPLLTVIAVVPNRVPVNDEPAFSSESVAYSLEENRVPHLRAIGAPVTANDADNDALTYALTGTDIANFDIDAATGQIKLKETLDYEAAASHSLTVTVSDGKNLDGETDPSIDDSIAVTINVIDIDEPASVAINPMVPQAGVRLTASLHGGNGKAKATTWSWSRSHKDWINSDYANWTLIPNANRSTYTPVDADVNNYLRATVRYTDERDPAQGRDALTETYFPVNPFIMEVVGPAEPVTGSFDLRVYFVQDMHYRGDERITVTGGELSGVQTIYAEASAWRLTVTPDSGSDAVQVSASEGTWCIRIDGACDMLSPDFEHEVTVSVPASDGEGGKNGPKSP